MVAEGAPIWGTGGGARGAGGGVMLGWLGMASGRLRARGSQVTVVLYVHVMHGASMPSCRRGCGWMCSGRAPYNAHGLRLAISLTCSPHPQHEVPTDPDSTHYRPTMLPLPERTPFTSLPCGVCPVFNDCKEGGPISPQTCEYYQAWLKFDF